MPDPDNQNGNIKKGFNGIHKDRESRVILTLAVAAFSGDLSEENRADLSKIFQNGPTKNIAANFSFAADLYRNNDSIKQKIDKLNNFEINEIIKSSKELLKNSDLPAFAEALKSKKLPSINESNDYEKDLKEKITDCQATYRNKIVTPELESANLALDELREILKDKKENFKNERLQKAIEIDGSTIRKPNSAKNIGTLRKIIGVVTLPVGAPLSAAAGLMAGIYPAYLQTKSEAWNAYLNEKYSSDKTNEEGLDNSGKEKKITIKKNYFNYSKFVGRVLQNAITGIKNGPKSIEDDGRSRIFSRIFAASSTLGFSAAQGFGGTTDTFKHLNKEYQKECPGIELPNPFTHSIKRAAITTAKGALIGAAAIAGAVIGTVLFLGSKVPAAALGYASHALNTPWKLATNLPIVKPIASPISNFTATPDQRKIRELEKENHNTKKENNNLKEEKSNLKEENNNIEKENNNLKEENNNLKLRIEELLAKKNLRKKTETMETKDTKESNTKTDDENKENKKSTIVEFLEKIKKEKEQKSNGHSK